MFRRPWLANWPAENPDDVPALLHFVAAKAKESKTPIEPRHLAWATRSLTSVLVLDGLDEVVAIKDRARLLLAMDALFHFIRSSPSSLVVVTTRPQGYESEIEKLGWKFNQLNLIPLNRFQALQYAQRLVDARFDNDRRLIVLRRLRDAAAGETTARLMRSPLQITILATLVDHIGQAPNERWTLFKEYYRVIYDREVERPGDAAQLLRDYRQYIDKIHTQVGLLLQVEAENTGGTSSSLTMERFRQVVDAVLAEDEIDGEERDEVAKRLTGLTGNRSASVMKLIGQRLVLLVEETPERVNFEVRSIQPSRSVPKIRRPLL